MTKNYACQKASESIYRQIRKLIQLFHQCINRKELINKLNEKLQTLDQKNEDFSAILGNTLLNLQMILYVLILAVSIIIDYLLLLNAVEILFEHSNLLPYLKIIVPAAFILAEVVISYFTLLKQHNLEEQSWIVRKLPYFLIIILTGLAALSVFYSINNYNREIDGTFLSFLFGTVLYQFILWLGSVFLHFWLVRNSVEITTAYAYFSFRIKRFAVTRPLKTQQLKSSKETIQFTDSVYVLVKSVDTYKKSCSGSDEHFQDVMPEHLIKAINAVMGRCIFAHTPPVEMPIQEN